MLVSALMARFLLQMPDEKVVFLKLAKIAQKPRKAQQTLVASMASLARILQVLGPTAAFLLMMQSMNV